jgi:endonuclease YncB( thermonuclease family)
MSKPPISRIAASPPARKAILRPRRLAAVLGILSLLLAWTQAACAGRELEGHAIVRSDGSLLIKNEVVRLHGIYIPPTERQCREWIRPIRCDSRAVLALDFRVKGFINCYVEHENPDGSLSATCYVDRTSFDPGEDLAAYLIERGWALALPNAPFEYHALERIATNRGVGVWGFQVDSFGERVFPRGHWRR